MDAFIEALAPRTVSEKINYSIATFGFWIVLFFAAIKLIDIPKMERRAAVALKQKFVALVYDVFVLVVPIYNYSKRGIVPKEEEAPEDSLVHLAAGSYYIAHMIIVVGYKITNFGQVLHHILTIAAIFSSNFTGFVQIGTLWLVIYQLSHVALHGRAIVKDLGLKYTGLYELVESIYFAVYLFERIVLGTWVLYQVIFHTNLSQYVVPLGVGLWVQSLYFCYHMIILAYKKVLKFKERCQKGIHYYWFEENPQVQKLSYYRREEKEKVF